MCLWAGPYADDRLLRFKRLGGGGWEVFGQSKNGTLSSALSDPSSLQIVAQERPFVRRAVILAASAIARGRLDFLFLAWVYQRVFRVCPASCRNSEGSAGYSDLY